VAPCSVLLDSCVIFQLPLRDTILRAAAQGLCRIYFSQEILDGATRNLVKKRKMTAEKAKSLQNAVLSFFPESLVEASPELEGLMTNHPGDRHVLAAAVKTKLDVAEDISIVTTNLKHFPKRSLKPWNITVQHPDEFLDLLCDRHGSNVLYKLVQQQASDCKKPPLTDLDILEKLKQGKCPKFASRMIMEGYGDMFKFVADNALKTVPKGQANQRCYSGELYNICQTSENLVISEKITEREVLRWSGETIVENIQANDIKEFQKAAQAIAPCQE
jgi:PIN domain